ncbi:hypothetical protein DL769_008803 [Monosporascus sp. CRB-8-3]|nr:hypothetical protein DL769_008803 [Monosporascus sp. CRB-8-3]
MALEDSSSSVSSDIHVTPIQGTPHVYRDVYPSVDPTRPELSLAGKIVVITGASRGIGSNGIAPAVAKAGAKGIVLVATNSEKLRTVEQSIRLINHDTQILAVTADISNKDSVTKLFKLVKDKFGHADVLVHNAAVMSGGGQIHELDLEEWWKNFEINTKGTFIVTQSFLQSLPIGAPAVIVNITTGGAWGSYPHMSGYATSKLAGQKLVSDIAASYPNIIAISLHPGIVKTDMLLEQYWHLDTNEPELVGGVVVWLAGDNAKFLSGRAISVNWSVDDLVARRQEIVKNDLLKMHLKGDFGWA